MCDTFNDKVEKLPLDPFTKARLKELCKEATRKLVFHALSNSSATSSSTDREDRTVSNIHAASPVSTFPRPPDQDLERQLFAPGASETWDSGGEPHTWNGFPFFDPADGVGPSLSFDASPPMSATWPGWPGMEGQHVQHRW
jgi:hypothetical protein